MDAEHYAALLRTVEIPEAAKLSDLLDTVERHAADVGFLDGLIRSFDVNQSTLLTVALARSTFRLRGELPSWKPFVESLRDSLASRNLDYPRILRGLL